MFLSSVASYGFGTRPRRIRRKKDRQCMYNVTERRVRVTVVAVGKAISITYSECMSVILVIQQATRMRHVVICGQSRSAAVFYMISQTARF